MIEQVGSTDIKRSYKGPSGSGKEMGLALSIVIGQPEDKFIAIKNRVACSRELNRNYSATKKVLLPGLWVSTWSFRDGRRRYAFHK
jgi:hypothetical protein